MRKFIFQILLFILIPTILLGIYYISTSTIHKFLPSKSYYYDDFNSAFDSKDADVLALGNSKLLSALCNQTYNKLTDKKLYNLGVAASNISVSRLILESYLNRTNKLPEMILLEVSWFTFNPNRTGFNKISGDLLIKDIKLVRYTFQYDNLFRYYFISSFNQYIKKRNNKSLSWNMEKRDSYDTKIYELNHESFKSLFPNNKAGIDKKLLADFNAFVDLCKKNNITLILFSAPEDEEYCLLQKDRNMIYKIFYDTESRYKNVYYLNYTLGGKYYNKSFENWLYNSHHIQANDLFTKKLLYDIDNHSSIKK